MYFVHSFDAKYLQSFKTHFGNNNHNFNASRDSHSLTCLMYMAGYAHLSSKSNTAKLNTLLLKEKKGFI